MAAWSAGAKDGKWGPSEAAPGGESVVGDGFGATREGEADVVMVDGGFDSVERVRRSRWLTQPGHRVIGETETKRPKLRAPPRDA